MTELTAAADRGAVQKRRGIPAAAQDAHLLPVYFSLVDRVYCIGGHPAHPGISDLADQLRRPELCQLKFIGFGQLLRAFNDPEVLFSFKQTVYWLFTNLPAWMILSFALALILNQTIKGRGIFRTLYYLPSIVPGAAAILAWKIILDKNNGLLNGVISSLAPGYGDRLAVGLCPGRHDDHRGVGRPGRGHGHFPGRAAGYPG